MSAPRDEKKWEIEGVQVVKGSGGLPVARVRTDLAEADVYLHGAHVTHFQPRHTKAPVLFLSEKAVFSPEKAIRGGIPICFPWFSDHGPTPDAPAHGFARTSRWELADATREAGGEVALTFTLTADEAAQKLWPHTFSFTYTVYIGRRLSISAAVTNRGDEAFRYELALHTYFHVGDVRQVRLEGFEGSVYLDQLRDMARLVQKGEPGIDGEVDRIYQGHERPAVIHDPVLGRRITVSKTGSHSTVLWNPHIAKAGRMSDFGDEEWPSMLCIESAAIDEHAIHLGAGESHTLQVTLDVE